MRFINYLGTIMGTGLCLMYFKLDDFAAKYYSNATKISLNLIQMTSTKYVRQWTNDD